MEMITSLTKGQQITIPAEIRKELKLHIGSRMEIELKNRQIIIKPIEEDIHQVFEAAKKIKPKYNLTAKEMDELNEKIMHEIHR